MKKSLTYLPEKKRCDLRQLVEIIRDEIKDCVMIILYGSYARNTYVDYDQRIEFGVPTYFMSDYDILIVTKKHLGINEHNIYDKILNRFYQHKNWAFHTHPQMINETITEFNKALDKRRFFFTDIKKDGVMLYDSGEYQLTRRRKLDYSEIKEMAQEYFDDKYTTASDFLDGAIYFYNNNKYKMAAFNLHQAAENFFRTIPLVFTLYGYKDHDLEMLMRYAKRHAIEVSKIFPRDTKEERRLFKLLQDAYVQARYNKNFLVAKEDINILTLRIKQLYETTGKVCIEQIAEFDRLSGKE